ncbi:MAG: hypothetical protein ACRDJ5_01495 [Actinomycetota bacterium]
MRTAFRSFVVAGLVVALGALPALAQRDARDKPRVSGPLRRVVRRCEQRPEEFNGRIVARAESCVWLYAFRARAERNDRRDYGAVWLQTELRTKPNWCATKARSGIRIPRRTRSHAGAPRRARAREPRRYVTRLRVDAQGNAARVGRIKQPFKLHPRVLRGRMVRTKRTFRATWEGDTPRTLAFATGVEISWRRGNPPARLATSFVFRMRRGAGC